MGRTLSDSEQRIVEAKMRELRLLIDGNHSKEVRERLQWAIDNLEGAIEAKIPKQVRHAAEDLARAYIERSKAATTLRAVCSDFEYDADEAEAMAERMFRDWDIGGRK